MALYSLRTFDSHGYPLVVEGLGHHFRAEQPAEALKKAMVDLAKLFYEPYYDQGGAIRLDHESVAQVNLYRTPWYPRKKPEFLLEGEEFQEALAEAQQVAAAWHQEREQSRQERRARKEQRKEERRAGWKEDGMQTEWPGLGDRPELSALEAAPELSADEHHLAQRLSGPDGPER